MDDHTKTPAQIEAEIEATRADIGSTLDALQKKLSPGELVDQAITYARGSAPKEFVENLSVTVRNNPVPTALLGIGLAWLMVSSKAPPRTDPMARSSTTDDVKDAASRGWNAASGAAESAADRVSGAADAVGDRIGDAVDGVRSGASRARDRVARLRTDAAEEMHHRGDQIRRGAHRVADTARHGIARAREGVESTRRGFNYLVHEQPLLLGAIGVAVGAAIAAALPATRREDALLGEVRDDVVDRAGDVGHEVVEGARDVAVAAGEAAHREVSARLDGKGSAAPAA